MYQNMDGLEAAMPWESVRCLEEARTLRGKGYVLHLQEAMKNRKDHTELNNDLELLSLYSIISLLGTIEVHGGAFLP